MRVWVTRSEPGASRLGTALREAGYDAWVEPVLEIEPTEFEPVIGTRFDTCVVLSGHAVSAAPSGCLRYLAVGGATADALSQQVGRPCEVADPASSEGVVRWLHRYRPNSVLIVTGEGGRGLVPAACERLGLQVQQLVVYRRRVRQISVKCSQISHLVAGSGDGVRAAAQVWFAAGGDTGVDVLVPSQRVGEAAVEAGFRRIVLCSGASPEAVLEGLRQAALLPGSE